MAQPHRTMTTAEAESIGKKLLKKQKDQGLTPDEQSTLSEAIVQRAANVTKPM